MEISNKTEFIPARKIEVPEIMFHPISTGYPEIDAALSAMKGIIPSQTILLTGPPGAGKTTVALMAISAMSAMQPANPAAFVSLEMTDWQLKLAAKKIPGFDLVNVSKSIGHKDSVWKALEAMKPCAVVIDSIQKWASMPGEKTGWKGGFNNHQKQIVDEAVKFAKKTLTPVFLIGHVSKSGIYIGPTHIEHEVDSHMEVKYDKEIDLRTFEMGTKNRFGGVNDTYLFGIEHDKVWVGTPFSSANLNGGKIGKDKTSQRGPVIEEDEMVNATKELRKKWNGSTSISAALSQPYLDMLTRHFETTMKDWLDKETPVKGSIVAVHGKKMGPVAHCQRNKATLTWGRKMNEASFQVGKIGYGKEQPYISRWCQDPIDLLIWIFFHEAAHLKEGANNHTVAFFQEVEALATKHSYLFSLHNPNVR